MIALNGFGKHVTVVIDGQERTGRVVLGLNGDVERVEVPGSQVIGPSGVHPPQSPPKGPRNRQERRAEAARARGRR